MAAPKKPPATAPIRIWSVDGSEVVAQGEVPVALLGKGMDRRELLRALSAPKRQSMSSTDAMGDMLRGAQKRTRAATLSDLQARVEQIEAKLGLGRHQRRQAGFLPADVMAPPP
jgi:hypothetical protein